MQASCNNYEKCKADEFMVCACQNNENNGTGQNPLIWDSYRGLALYAAKHFIGKALYDHTEQHWKLYENGVWVADEKGKFIREVESCLLDAVQPLLTEAIKDEKDKLEALPKDDPEVKQAKAKKTAIVKQKSAIDDPSLMKTKILARMASELGCVLPEFDKDISRVCLTNGVYDFDMGAFLPHSPAFMFTKNLPFSYDPQAQCPKWEAFLKLILRDKQDVIQYLQKIFGYCLTGYNSLQSVFFLYGGGENGKSMVINVLKYLVGEDANGYFYQFDYDQLLTKTHGIDSSKQYTLAKLHGKRVICSTEISSKMTLDTAMVKNLTGGDSIAARNPAGRPFNYKPVYKLLMYGNHFPVITETDDGIKRRIKLLKFDYSFKTEGAHLKRDATKVLKEFMEEAQGIFNWAIEGYKLYLQEGIKEPESVKKATEQYLNEEDIILQFIQEACVLEDSAKTKATDLWAEFRKWDMGNSYRAGRNQFYRDLESKGCKKVREAKLNQTVICGIRVKDMIEAAQEASSHSLDAPVFAEPTEEAPF